MKSGDNHRPDGSLRTNENIVFLSFFFQEPVETKRELDEIREKRLSYFRSQTNSVALDEFSEVEETMSTEAENDKLQDFNDNIEIPEDEFRPPQQAELVSNERTSDLELECPKPDQLSLDRNSSPIESQLEDIDIEQCDFVSEESKVSPEDELIELLKSGAIDMSSPEYSRDSFDVAEEDPQESLVTDVQSFPEEVKEYSSVELDAFAGNKAETKSDGESDSSDDVIERFEASLSPEERTNYIDYVIKDLKEDGSLKGDEQDSITSDEDEAPEREVTRLEAPEGEAPEGEASEYEAHQVEAPVDKAPEGEASELNEPERGEPERDEPEREEPERETPEREESEHDELEDTALSETSANIEKLVARLGEIENELSESEGEGLGTIEATSRSSDEEFEEIERLLYEEKALIEAEEKSKQSAHETTDDSSDEEFERLERELYEQKARGEASEAAENMNKESPEEFTKTASDEEFEQLEKMASDEKAANRVQPYEFMKKGNDLESLSSDIEDQAVDSNLLSSLPSLPVSSRKTEEDDDLLDIIGASDSEISDSSEDLEEVQKLIVAQASSDDRETLGSDEEEKNPVMWSVSVRTSAPAPPVTAPVASEHNVAFVSMELMRQTNDRPTERTNEGTNDRPSDRMNEGTNERKNK